MDRKVVPCGAAPRHKARRAGGLLGLAGYLGLAICAGFSSPAAATEVFGSASVPVYDRVPVSAEDLYKISPYEAHPGVTLGSFLFRSSVAAAVTFDDNVFATPTNRKSDIFYTVNPEVYATSQWARHSLEFLVGGTGAADQRYSSEAQGEFHTGFNGVLDVRNDLRILARGTYLTSFEPRGTGQSFSLFDSPIRYQSVDGALSINKDFARTFVQFGGVVRNITYDDAKLHGVIVDQSYRNGTASQLVAKVGHEVSGKTAVFVEGDYDWRSYGDRAFSGDGYRLLGGVKYEFTSLIRGEIAAGLLHEDFDAFKSSSIDTYTYRAQLLWIPTPLITVALLGNRDLGTPSAYITGSNVVTSTAGTRVDYAFRRDLTFFGVVTYGASDYVDLKRTDTWWQTGGGAAYQFNPDWALVLSYDHMTYTANAIPNVDYDRDRVTLGIRTRY